MAATVIPIIALTSDVLIETHGHRVWVHGNAYEITGRAILASIDTTGWPTINLEGESTIVPAGFRFVLVGPPDE